MCLHENDRVSIRGLQVGNTEARTMLEIQHSLTNVLVNKFSFSRISGLNVYVQ